MIAIEDGDGDGMIQDGDSRRPMTDEERKEQVKRLVTVFCWSIHRENQRVVTGFKRKTKQKTNLSTSSFPRLEELMRVKQEERRERERKDEVEREKQRRKQGQELLQIKSKLQEDEMKKLADDRRREKMEDRLAK